MLSSPVSSSSLFASLPARPPTPPKDISEDVDDAFRFLEEGHLDDSETRTKLSRLRRSTETPPERSPASLQARSSTAEKRVDFSPFPIVHTLPQAGLHKSPAHRIQKQTPLRFQTKPLKSILKANNDRLPLTPDDLETKLSYFSPQEPGSFGKMLQSVLSQLASPARDDRRDAYLAINGAMKHYEGVPDTAAICDKMALIQQFLSRDLSWQDPAGRLDVNVVTQALQLTLTMLHNPETEPAFDDDFRNLLVERSMAVLEQDEPSKAIYKLHMYLLSQQRFSPRIVTATRVERLVTVLQKSEERCSGNSIVASRLIVYGRLFKQAPTTMLNRMRDWIEFIFHGLLSSIPDIRIRAIDTCTQAGLMFGDHSQAGKVMFEVTSGKEQEEGQRYGDYLNARLKEMSSDKEQAKWVPQIWGAVILLFRSQRRPIEKWPCFTDWVAVIQKSLNSTDAEVKLHAHLAWNRLIYTVTLNSGSNDTMKSMLRIPIVAGLERRGVDRLSQQHRQFAMDTYCILLHYSLRPGQTYEDIDQAWKLYVEPILSKMAQGTTKSQQRACLVLHGLLQRSSSGVWNKNAANELGPMKLQDLPRLDPRWVRSRLANLIAIMEPMIISGMWLTPDANEAINDCWGLIFDAVAEAGSQEVKASNELKEAMAQLTNLFRRIWNGDWKSRNEVEASVWLDRYHLLLNTAISRIGPVHFVEDVLSKTANDSLEAAATPSQRTAKHSVVAYPAFVFLFALYYQAPTPLRTSGLYKDSAHKFLRLLAGAKGSTTGTLALLHRALQFSAPTAEQSDIASQLWSLVGLEAVDALHTDPTTTPLRDAQVMGNALRSAVNILLHGLRYMQSSPDCLDRAIEMYGAACWSGKHFANDGGVVLGVMEPLAKSLVELLNDLPVGTFAHLTQSMLQMAAWPKTRQELDLSRKALWTVSLELRRTPSFSPYEHVYGFLNGMLIRSYEKLGEVDASTSRVLCDVLKSLAEFLRSCPQSMLTITLCEIQAGIARWIADSHRWLFPLTIDQTNAHRLDITESLSVGLIDLWSLVITVIEKLLRTDSALLQSWETILIAAMSSPSRDIVNKTISFWNQTFGQSSTLEYPPCMVPVLRARALEVQLDLPGFPTGHAGSDVASLPAFAEAEDDHDLPEVRLTAGLRNHAGPLINFSNAGSSARQQLSKVEKPTPNKRGKSSASSTPRSRFRHDDSQIDFAPVETLLVPSTEEQESQQLTEHQKEVKTRQLGDAQMYPDLSSSPMSHADSRARRVSKKLDFASSSMPEQDQNNIATTPTGLADTNPMSDDLPSSPTPRSNAVSRTDGTSTQYSDDDEETVLDPPSSPPRVEDEPQQSVFVIEPPAHAPTATDQSDDIPAAHTRQPNVDDDVLVDPSTAQSDLPSDTQLPTAQLEREAAAADAVDTEHAEGEVAVAEDLTERQTIAATEERQTINAEETTVSFETTLIKETQARESRSASRKSPQTPSRIEDSMREASASHDGTPAGTDIASESATPRTRGQRKRRRNDEVVTTTKPAKKRVKSSPFRLWDRLRGMREADDDDIEEEIVVASSQPRDSPPPAAEPAPIEFQSESQFAEVSLDAAGEIPIVPEVPAKRKRGRPRKSGSHIPIEVVPTSAKPLKRSASVLSTTSIQDESVASVASNTRAVRYARKYAMKSARLSQDAADSTSATRKVALGVLPSPPPVRPDSEEEDAAAADADEADVSISPGQQLSQEAAESERRILQPKSILGRLRGVLADCKKMVFGSVEEERAFDDILFEIRREVHEAGRRQHLQ